MVRVYMFYPMVLRITVPLLVLQLLCEQLWLIRVQALVVQEGFQVVEQEVHGIVWENSQKNFLMRIKIQQEFLSRLHLLGLVAI